MAPAYILRSYRTKKKKNTRRTIHHPSDSAMLPYPQTKKSKWLRPPRRAARVGEGGRRFKDKFPPGGPRRRKEACSPAALGLECPSRREVRGPGNGRGSERVPGKEAGGVRNTTTPAAAGKEEKKREIRGWGLGAGRRTDRDRSRLRGKLLTSVRSCPSRVTRGRGGSSVAAAAWA